MVNHYNLTTVGAFMLCLGGVTVLEMHAWGLCEHPAKTVHVLADVFGVVVIEYEGAAFCN